MNNKVKLYLATGHEFIADSFGAPIDKTFGELVFNTSMTGYQEVLSDPSYFGQIVTMTFPTIGNYGVNKDDYESLCPSLSAMVVKQACDTPSHWKSLKSIGDCLRDFNIPGISGIDTRMLTKIIRTQGCVKSVLANADYSFNELKILLEAYDPGQDHVARVSSAKPQHFPGRGKRVILLDYGYKKNILYSLLKRQCDVIVVPYNTHFDQIKHYSPDGILLSNGPGDPTHLPQICFETVRKLQESYPLFGICLGHQILALSNGAQTEKLKFGHRGSNHPVKDFKRDRVFMTSQNHGYSVVLDSLAGTSLELTQSNLNDDSVEGLRHRHLPAFSVQYHPEAHPGPFDTQWLFDDFMNLMESSHA